MLRRRPWPLFAAAGVALVGVALVVVGALLATVWKAPTTSEVRVLAAEGTPAVVTAPGALSLDGPTVRVEAFAASGSQPVFLGVARTADAQAWLGDGTRQVLRGVGADGGAILASEGSRPTLADPAAADIWVASVSGRGSAGLTWPEQDGAWSLVATTDGTVPPELVSLTWPLDPQTSLAPALVALGVLLVVSGVVTLGLLVARAREEVEP